MVIISTTFSELEKYKYKDSIISIGSFDGLHLAHQKIFNKMNNLKNKKNVKNIVCTFDPHPRLVLQETKVKEKYLLTSLKDKINLIQNHGIDILVIISFTKDTALISAEAFLNKIIQSFNPIHFVIGYSHSFGYKREGNIDFVKSSSKDLFKVHLIEKQVNINQEIISSTSIRNYISNGKIDNANLLLGREYSLRGIIVSGMGIGRKINFPTINVKPLDNYQLIPFRGVYSVQVKLENKLYSGMCNIGFRPTLTNNKEESIEVHIFNVGINKDFYKKEVEVFFVKYLRKEKKFKNLDFLKKQLEEDKRRCLSVEM